MPEDGQAWRDTLSYLDADATGRCGTTFAQASVADQRELVQAVQDRKSGDWHGLEPDFVVTRSGDEAHWRADLTPRRPDAIGMPLRDIAVSGSRFVDQVQIDKPDGDFEHLAFLDQVLSNGPLRPDEAATLASPGR